MRTHCHSKEDSPPYMREDLSRVIVSEEQIRERVEELGQQITETYRAMETEEITVICITNGAIIFCADLLRRLQLHAQLDCIRVSSYHDETRPVSEPEIIDHIRLDISQRHVLLIDDILDTGRTLKKIVAILSSLEPASLKTCILLDKKGRREVDYDADFVGFDIPDTFVVGYGLDFAERYRNLPLIGALRADMQNPPSWR